MLISFEDFVNLAEPSVVLNTIDIKCEDCSNENHDVLYYKQYVKDIDSITIICPKCRTGNRFEGIRGFVDFIKKINKVPDVNFEVSVVEEGDEDEYVDSVNQF